MFRSDIELFPAVGIYAELAAGAFCSDRFDYDALSRTPLGYAARGESEPLHH